VLCRLLKLSPISSTETNRHEIAARVSNTPSGHNVEVETEGRKQSIAIAPKIVGQGSRVNGGELLFAALATCVCNDLCRQAAKRNIAVQDVKV
jgi:uncharacterized OsmC-like protein